MQHAQYLAQQGYAVTIALVFMKMEDYIQLKNSPQCWHPAIKSLQFIDVNDCMHQEFDVAIYTWWATLFSFEKVSAKYSAYFVQSIESRFYPKEKTFIRDLVDRTYQFGLPMVTEAHWIQQYLQSINNNCDLVRNGILKSVYTENGKRIAEKSTQTLRILVEGPLEVAFKNVSRTVELCRLANVGEIWLLTSSDIESYPGVDRVFSRVAIAKVPEIYRSCDVLVKLSFVEGMFGPPLEMFHCGGTAIVYSVTGFDEYIEHDVNALVAMPDDEETVVDYLRNLHQDRHLLARLTMGARQTASQWIDWDRSSLLFTHFINKILAQTKSENTSYLAKIKKHLHEYIEVIFSDNQTKVFVASPLYDSGHYTLAIPIQEGTTQFSILFGKKYHELSLLAFKLINDNSAHHSGHIDVKLNDITQSTPTNFICHSKSSQLLITTTLTNTTPQINANAYLSLDFSPISIFDESIMISCLSDDLE